MFSVIPIELAISVRDNRAKCQIENVKFLPSFLTGFV